MASKETKSIRVLVVDDQRSTRMLIRSTLTTLGCTIVAECADGNEAVAYLGMHQVDLIISDLTMPNLDGFGLLQAVRANQESEKTPFIMLTSHGDLAMVKDAVTRGVNNYIVKPFTIGTMKSKIEALLGPLA